MAIGERGNPALWGMVGWQWVFIFWGIPAVVLGILTLAYLTDRPRQAHWLTAEERAALEATLERERREHPQRGGHLPVFRALADPKVLALSAAYFFVVTGSYGVELYMASIVKDWYGLDIKSVAYLIIIPPAGALVGQLLVGWNSDRTHERRWHASLPIIFGALALAAVPDSKGTLWVTIALFTAALVGMKAYLPAFWALPNLFLAESAAAASIGMINSCGNLGGWVGPTVLGFVKQATGAYRYGLWYLSASVIISAFIIVSLGIGGRPRATTSPGTAAEPGAEAVPDPDAIIEPV
jgi:ACS family tartrate transporter-like MFS transporter